MYLSRVLNELACTMNFSQWEIFLVLTEDYDSLVRISSFVGSLESINSHEQFRLAKWPPLAKTLASKGVLGHHHYIFFWLNIFLIRLEYAEHHEIYIEWWVFRFFTLTSFYWRDSEASCMIFWQCWMFNFFTRKKSGFLRRAINLSS